MGKEATAAPEHSGVHTFIETQGFWVTSARHSKSYKIQIEFFDSLKINDAISRSQP